MDSLGWAYFKKGLVEEAIVELEKAIKLMPTDPTIADHLGDAYYKKGLSDKAQEFWKRSLEIDPNQDKVKQKLENIKKEISRLLGHYDSKSALRISKLRMQLSKLEQEAKND